MKRLHVTIEADTFAELHDQIENLYTHMVADAENNCECCDHPGGPKNEILHELPDRVKAAQGAVQEPAKSESKVEPSPESEARQEAENMPAMEDVRAALNEMRKAKGVAAVKRLLAAYGADTFPALDTAYYAAVMQEVAADAAT